MKQQELKYLVFRKLLIVVHSRMRLNTIQLLLHFSATILTTSCSGQSLSGRWKLQQVDLMDVRHQIKKFTIDLTKPEKMKALLYEANIPDENSKADSLSLADNQQNGIDTSLNENEIKADIDKYVAASLNTSMTLKSDNNFYMNSNGLIFQLLFLAGISATRFKISGQN